MKSCTSATLDECYNRIASDDTPAINIDILLSRCMGKRPFALMLLGELESSGMQQVDTIVLHAASGEPLAAAEAAHALKGAAAIIGAESLSRIAAEIEAAGRNGETTLLMNLIPQLRNEMARCLSFVSAFRNTAH